MSAGPIMIMAGGTGGHVFPGLAVAAELKARQREVVWLGTQRGLEARLVPQHGITYFIAGSGGQLRRGGVARSAMTAAAYDEDRCFMLVEIAGDRMSFETVSRTGEVVDAGVVARRITGTQEEQP